jgi:rhomboid protease GluP
VNPYQNPIPAPQPAALRLPTYRPRVTYVMMGILIIVFVIETLAGGSEKPRVLISLGANVGPLVTTGDYWRLFTANFLHIGLVHIAFNLYALYILGTEVEMFYGPWRFLVIYLLSALCGALASYAFTYGLSAGASTAVFGLVGTLVAFFIRNRAVFGEMSRTRLTNLVIVIVINVFYGLSAGTIDNWGHIGGFVGGIVLGWLLCPFYQIEARSDGARHVVDRNSLRAEWLGVALVVALMGVAFWAALQHHSLNPMQGF